MTENGKLSLVDAIQSCTAEDVTALDKAISDVSEQIAELENRRGTLRNIRAFAARLLGIEVLPLKTTKGAGAASSLSSQIELLLKERGPLTTLEISKALGRKEGGVKLSIIKMHFKFRVLDDKRISLVGAA